MRRFPSTATAVRCAFVVAGVLALASCGTAPVAPRDNGSRPAKPDTPAAPQRSAAVQKLINESQALMPLAQSDLTKNFLSATTSLPSVGTRTIYRNDNTREYFARAVAEVMPAEKLSKLVSVEQDESRYYNTKYGSPLAYMRPLDIIAAQGFNAVSGKRILDFGYGSIGHLRLLASLGADVTGVDPDSYLEALYSEPHDQGRVPAVGGLFKHAGNITLAHGLYPKDPAIAARVGGNYDLIISKNTLKRGYLKPERKADPRTLIHLGVSDEEFLGKLFAALRPGGRLMIYNLYPKPSAPNETYKPWSDGRSPFSEAQFVKAGFRVRAFDVPDHSFARTMGRALGWDRDDKGEVMADYETNMNALYTIVERPAVAN